MSPILIEILATCAFLAIGFAVGWFAREKTIKRQQA